MRHIHTYPPTEHPLLGAHDCGEEPIWRPYIHPANPTWNPANWLFPKIVVPQNGWFIMENLIKGKIWGYPYFWKHPIEVWMITFLQLRFCDYVFICLFFPFIRILYHFRVPSWNLPCKICMGVLPESASVLFFASPQKYTATKKWHVLHTETTLCSEIRIQSKGWQRFVRSTSHDPRFLVLSDLFFWEENSEKNWWNWGYFEDLNPHHVNYNFINVFFLWGLKKKWAWKHSATPNVLIYSSLYIEVILQVKVSFSAAWCRLIMTSNICVQKDIKKNMFCDTVDGRNPTQTNLPVNHGIFSISTGIQLVQDFFHEQYGWILATTGS